MTIEQLSGLWQPKSIDIFIRKAGGKPQLLQFMIEMLDTNWRLCFGNMHNS